MKKRALYGGGLAAFAVLVALVVWQGSFSFGDYVPSNPQETVLFWAISTVVFLLTVTLGFILFRTSVKLYIERQSGKVGSSIKVKLVGGALALSVMPVFFLVIWSVSVLNRTLDKWFSRPAENISLNLRETGRALESEARGKAEMHARLIASLVQVAAAIDTGSVDRRFFSRLCHENAIRSLELEPGDGPKIELYRAPPADGEKLVTVSVPAGPDRLILQQSLPLDVAIQQQQIDKWLQEYDLLSRNRRYYRLFYLQMLLLITLFILFVATWISLFLARQISIPIEALLQAAREVRNGNLSFRVNVRAVDELATLVRSFNEMTHDLETNSRELERRRRFAELLLESIPTGVISLASDGHIQRINRALARIFPGEAVEHASRLEDLLSREDTAELRYLMKRARRTGVASRQLELKRGDRTFNLSVTVAALEEKVTSGFVVVIEDTSELLRAQKAAAWHEVARRVAHEIKNPLTPISLCADRIVRQLDRLDAPSETQRIVTECAAIIAKEVESVRGLVDEFSQFARFPAAQKAPANLNQVVEDALAVFHGRLEEVEVHTDLAPSLPVVFIDSEQFKRVIVNLVDNAAEAMHESTLRRLLVSTSSPSPEVVELTIADTGCGVSTEDRERLFLPYFSTKGRGTGLGLAIVNHILADHDAHIRVEDNRPAGARFIIEIPAYAGTAEAENRGLETRA